MTRPYRPPFEAFVAPARPGRALWRLVLGLALAGLIYVTWSIGVLSLAYRALGEGSPGRWMALVAEGERPGATFLLFSTFVGMALGAAAAARVLHGRRPGTLFGRAPIVLRDFVTSAGLVGAVYAAALGGWFLVFEPEPGLDLSLWILLLPFGLLALLVQTGAEEMLFRGYLQQQLAARFRTPLAWLVLPSLAFGLAHYDPSTSGANVWLTVGATLLFGLAAADLTAATGSIGAAWGFHFVNNFAAILIIAVKGTIPGLALFLTPYPADDPSLRWLILFDIAALLVAWALVRRAVQR